MPKSIAECGRFSASIAREALLDIKFRRQSRIRFANALRTTPKVDRLLPWRAVASAEAAEDDLK
jgi:hypothetical protein